MDTQLRRLIGGWDWLSKLFSKIDSEEQYQCILECIAVAKAKRDDEGIMYLDGLVHMLTLLAKEYEVEHAAGKSGALNSLNQSPMDTQLRRAIKGWTGISKIFSRIDCEGQYQYILDCIKKTMAIRDTEGPRDLDSLVHMLTLMAKNYEAESSADKSDEYNPVGGFDEMFIQGMQNPEVKREYDALEAEFDALEAEIRESRSLPIPPDVLELAVSTLGSHNEALTWLLQPARSLGGERPIWVAQTEEGAQKVKTLLGQIEHGVFI